jgi:His-Xaa-Ser system radical SAM maturase HxsB
MRWNEGEVLVTNDVGESLFLNTKDFEAFTGQTLNQSDDAYADLKARHFLQDSRSSVPLELLATKYRTKKAFLEGFTGLHMFVVTLRCDHSCPYCQVSRVTEDRSRFDMSEATALKAVDLMFRSPSPLLKVEFQGGEPLLNFELVRVVVNAVKSRNVIEQRDIQFVIATNMALLTDDVLAFCAEHQICLSTSLDGPSELHNANRPRPGANSYEVLLTHLARARATLGHDRISALMTTTERSLERPDDIVDEYVRQGFDTIFLRPISPYGFAVRSRLAFRYQADQFIAFYKSALKYIIDINRRGTPLMEVYTQILLQRMLTPFATGYVDLQSPTGAGIGAVVYNYDGDVYASDEGRMLAEMGDTTFRLGHVHSDSYEEIFAGDHLRKLIEGSCLETLPGCSECAFMPYCGADPVFHWATQQDAIGHRPTSAFCARQMGVFRHLFDLLRKGDSFTRELLLSWATQASPAVSRAEIA